MKRKPALLWNMELEMKDTCHDSGDGRGDPVAEEPEGVGGDLLWGGAVLALCTRSDHARLEEDALKQHIVLSQVEKDLCPNL